MDTMCGIIGVVSHGAAEKAHAGLAFLQHRGQDAAGLAVAFASQCAMHFLGLGKMVMNEGTMVLRTPRSGKKREKGILASLERIILAPMSRAIMRDMDKDGDGRISFDEMMEEMGGESKEEIIEAQELFDKHDEDGDGYLTLKELEGLIRESGDETWAEKEANWWSKEDN